VQCHSRVEGTYNIPRIQRLLHRSMSVPGSTIAGSLPPSSRVTGVRCCAAARATWKGSDTPQSYSLGVTNLTADTLGTYESDVLNFRRSCQALCLIREAAHKLFRRRKIASSDERCRLEKEHTWTSSGSKLHARRHSLMTSTNQAVDQATCSEHLMTIALPANMAARIGDQALCNAEGDE